MNQISILGCGWLGFPLAQSLLQSNFLVKGSTTAPDKIEIFINVGIDPFLISVKEDIIEGNFDEFLLNSTILIINIPPKLRGNQSENFILKIKNCIPFIEKSSVKKVIFVSSSSVYADDNAIVSQFTNPNPDSESGRQLLQVENLLQSNLNFKTTIVRFGGLIGNDRHPIKMLSGKIHIANPEAPVNLIHQNDCIAIIKKIIQTDAFGKTYNAVSPFHPSRKTYYTQKAIDLNIPLPEFETSKPSVGKTIMSDYLCVDLNFNFKNDL